MNFINMNNREVYSYLIIPIVFMIIIWSCTQDKPLDPPKETYRLYKSSAITTEYAIYKFLSGERRYIFAGGQRPSSNLTRVWIIDNTGTRQDYFDLKNETNSYLGSDGEYTAPLQITAPYSSGFYIYTVHLGNVEFSSSYNTTFSIEIISNRNYPIEYSYMGSDYDLLTKGYQFMISLRNAINSANTNVSFLTHRANIPIENIKFIANDDLMNWGHQYATDGSNHNPNIVVLFGVKDYNGTEVSYGKTARDENQIPPRKSYAFVFLKRIDDDLSSYPDTSRQIMKTRTSIHELGHARRKDLSYADYSEEYLHEGKNKSVCAMMQLNVYDPKKAFNFCERHKQVFLNISW